MDKKKNQMMSTWVYLIIGLVLWIADMLLIDELYLSVFAGILCGWNGAELWDYYYGKDSKKG